MQLLLILACFILTISQSVLQAQMPTAEERQTFEQQLKVMSQKLDELEDSWDKDDQRHGVSYVIEEGTVWSDFVDLAVHVKAIDWILRHNEFSKKATAKQTKNVVSLADSMLRQVQNDGTRSYRTGKQICGYRSAVDGSFQPYVLTLPSDFDPKRPRAKRMPLYVVLHGRGGRNEVAFIDKNSSGDPIANQSWIQIDVFGRIDNAYRWAGETDVFEAIKDVSRRFPIDDRRITLWGFSMGGAGAWHLGLHYPDRWVSAGAGAGFVDFYQYQKQTEELPAYQHGPLKIYDTINYAENLATIPFVTYGGDQDSQLKTSLMMQAEAEKADVPLKLIIGKNIGHKFTPEGAAEFQEFLATYNQKGLPRYPGHTKISFTTYTPKYNKCFWFQIEELEQLYERAHVTSTGVNQDGVLSVQTTNLKLVSVSRDIAEYISFDEEPPLELRDAAEGLLPSVYFEKLDAGWEVMSYDDSREYQDVGNGRKRHNLQGPIDDAFMSSFICVRGTSKAWSQEHEDWANWTLKRFEKEFDKWMRAKIRIIDDKDLTPEQIASSNLILFGDPGSNEVIQQIVEQLPMTWTKSSYELDGQSWPTKSHGVAMIYPNPLNPNNYVVLNSGMTTHEADFKASNSWLFPKLGDVSVLKFERNDKGYEETNIMGSLFDSEWQLPQYKAD